MKIYPFRTPQAKFTFLWRFKHPIETDEYTMYFLIGIPFLSIALLKMNK